MEKMQKIYTAIKIAFVVLFVGILMSFFVSTLTNVNNNQNIFAADEQTEDADSQETGGFENVDPIELNNGKKSNAVLITVIVVSSVSVAAVGGYFVVKFIKSRKY